MRGYDMILEPVFRGSTKGPQKCGETKGETLMQMQI